MYLPPPDARSYHPLRHLLYLTVWKPYLENSPHWKLVRESSLPDLSNRDPIVDPTHFPYFSGSGKIFHHLRVFPITWLTDKEPCARLFKKGQLPFNLPDRAHFYPPTFIYDPSNSNHSLVLKQYYSSIKKSKSNPNPLWYYKPSVGGGTRGVVMSHNFEQLFRYARLQGKKAILQQEIQSPLLIEGRKTEIRWYVVWCYSQRQLSLWWWPEGYLVISPRNYDNSSTHPSVHFTNRSTSSLKERQTQIYQLSLTEAYENGYTDENLNIHGETLAKDISKRLCDYLSSQSLLSQNNNKDRYLGHSQYEVLALDAIWSQKTKKLSLVEINRYPGLYLSRDIASCRRLKQQFYIALMVDIIEPLLRQEKSGGRTKLRRIIRQNI